MESILQSIMQTVLDLHHMGCECVDTHRPVSLCYDATLEKVPDSLGSCTNLQVRSSALFMNTAKNCSITNRLQAYACPSADSL